MSEVSIAPCRRLGQNRQTSINEQSTLPLGDDVAVIRQKFNDDSQDVRSMGPFVSDTATRDSSYQFQQIRVEQRSLVGKHASEASVITADLTAMRQLNMKMDKNAQDIEIKTEREAKYNLVWDPFTTAETFNPWSGIT
jgi:hypothetical protein